jgi:hypothetical protein
MAACVRALAGDEVEITVAWLTADRRVRTTRPGSLCASLA